MFDIQGRAAMNWELLILFISLIVLVITLWYIINTLSRVAEHAELLRKQVFGEIYQDAQIKELQFYLPEREKHAVEGFGQKEDVETIIGTSATIPENVERELHIRWTMAESQTLRSFVVAFDGKFKSKPQIVTRTRAFSKVEISTLPREEYFDYHGNYHCEFGYARRLPKNETFVSSLRARGIEKGSYDITVEIFVAEAPNPYRGTLKVIVS